MVHNNRCSREAFSLLQLSLMILLLPIRLLIASAAAAAIHELGHYCAVRFCGGAVRSIRPAAAGILMHAVVPAGPKEIVCLLAGPVAGFATLLFYRWFPLVSVCALVQSTFNMLPIYPLDGGRMLRCIATELYGDYRVCKWLEVITATVVLAVVTYLSFIFDFGLVPVLMGLCVLVRTWI